MFVSQTAQNGKLTTLHIYEQRKKNVFYKRPETVEAQVLLQWFAALMRHRGWIEQTGLSLTYCRKKQLGLLLTWWRQQPPPLPTAPCCSPVKGDTKSGQKNILWKHTSRSVDYLSQKWNSSLSTVRNSTLFFLHFLCRIFQKALFTIEADNKSITDHDADEVAVKLSVFNNPQSHFLDKQSKEQLSLKKNNEQWL